MKINRIWWHELSPEDFFAMEKASRLGVRGQSSIELRRVPELLEFFGYSPNLPADRWSDVTLDVNVIGAPERQMPLRFASHRRHGTFELIGQNPYEERSGRHPAWTPEFHWPETSVPDGLDEAASILQDLGGIHLYVVRTQNGRHWAGATVGRRLPVTWPDSLEPLFTGTGSGVITIGHGALAQLTPLARKILSAFRDRKNVLVYGPPATGKTHAVAQVRRVLDEEWSGGESITLDPTRLDRPFLAGFEESPLAGPVLTDWVTFHQDYGYEDFIIGLRPTGHGIRLAPFAGRLLDLAVRLDRQRRGSALLVIDEINRGNVPRILGDFMTFMDTSYRRGTGSAPNPYAVPVTLPKVQHGTTGDDQTEPIWMLSGDSVMLSLPWYFPQELYLVATMNSIDRALAPLDSAVGRRFERIDAFADPDYLAEHHGVSMVAVADLMEAPDVPVDQWNPPSAAVALLIYLNNQITERLGQDYELGHLYFWHVKEWSDLQRVWDHDIWPQIRDRFGGRPDQLAEVLRVNVQHTPKDYPFGRRTYSGRAVAVQPWLGMSALATAETVDFLVRG